MNEYIVGNMSDLEAEYAFQVTDGLGHNSPHVQESGLQVILYRYFLAFCILDPQLRSEHISSPEARPVSLMPNMSSVLPPSQSRLTPW